MVTYAPMHGIFTISSQSETKNINYKNQKVVSRLSERLPEGLPVKQKQPCDNPECVASHSRTILDKAVTFGIIFENIVFSVFATS